MTSKERVLATFANQEPDRVPINYLSNPGIDRRLKDHFGIGPDDGEGLLLELSGERVALPVDCLARLFFGDPEGMVVDLFLEAPTLWRALKASLPFSLPSYGYNYV